MRKDTALIIVSMAAATGMIVLGPTINLFRGGTETTVDPPLASVTETVDGMVFERIPDDVRIDFCSMKKDPEGKCVKSDVLCPDGWSQVCQGSCTCGGSICQCVKQSLADEVNVCGNGRCEPREYTVQEAACKSKTPSCDTAATLIPTCKKDCSALARSGTSDSVCFDTNMAACLKSSKDVAGCQLQAERVCGATGLSPSCDKTEMKKCLDVRIAKKISAGDALEYCTEQCRKDTGVHAAAPEAPRPAPVGGCSSDEFAACVTRTLPKKRALADAQDECTMICRQIQTDRSYVLTLTDRINTCAFETMGRCCQIEKVITPGVRAEKCTTSCAARNVPAGDASTCL